MQKPTVLLTLLLVSLTFAFGQTATDPITMKKVFGGYQYYQGEKLLTMNQLIKTVKPNEKAYKQIKSAQSTYTAGMIFSYAGGFMIGWPLGTALAGGEPNWTIAGIGAGLLVLTIPITKSYHKKTTKAVDIYNSGLTKSSFRENKTLRLSMTGYGIGLTLHF
ncbi:MAG: hypothetical protein V2I54_14135 [Bacteroidales bacterium]|jgi:hypothetical protein|nr:hypothetical protein [Bacteroidales bacterium]